MEFRTEEVIIVTDRKINKTEENLLNATANLLSAILLAGQAPIANRLLSDVCERLREDYNRTHATNI